MRLFTIGPTQMRKEIMEVGGKLIPYFRTPEFSNSMLDSDRLLKKFMNAGKGAQSTKTLTNFAVSKSLSAAFSLIFLINFLEERA